jgi:hypothetical protein
VQQMQAHAVEVPDMAQPLTGIELVH